MTAPAEVNCRCEVREVVTDPAVLRALIRCTEMRLRVYLESDDTDLFAAGRVRAIEQQLRERRALLDLILEGRAAGICT